MKQVKVLILCERILLKVLSLNAVQFMLQGAFVSSTSTVIFSIVTIYIYICNVIIYLKNGDP